jgi:hypothetical protein
MTLPFEPACLPLLLGSLPYRSAAQAIEFSRRYAGALLAWPQLPQRGFREQSFVQSAIGFPGLVIDAERARIYVDRRSAEREIDRLALAYLENDLTYAALADDDVAGLTELFRQRDSLRGVLALKGQLLGPISLAAQLTDERQRPLIYDSMFFEALGQHLRLRAAWQEMRLSNLIDTTIICLDEPFLEAVGLPFLPLDWKRAHDQIDEALAGVHGCKALFAAGAVNWSQVLQTSIELIIADVYAYGHALVAAAAALPAFLDRSGIVGLGLIPIDADALSRATAEGLLGRAMALVDDLERAGVAPERLLRQAVVSTTGALSRLTIADAERAVQLVAEVSSLLRAHYTLA